MNYSSERTIQSYKQLSNTDYQIFLALFDFDINYTSMGNKANGRLIYLQPNVYVSFNFKLHGLF